MSLKISQFTDNTGARRLLFETLEGTSYTSLRDQVFSDTWEASIGPSERVAVVEPPPGRSVALAVGVALSWDGEASDVEWFIRAPNGSHRSLGTSNIAAGVTANAIYFLTHVPSSASSIVRSTAETIFDRGALCVTITGDCGIYVTGWVI